MRLYSQCYNGTMIPYISFDGYVSPCCLLNRITPKILTVDGAYIDSPFYDDDFSLYKKSYMEIVTSDKWNNMIESLPTSRISQCWKHCSHSSTPIHSVIRAIDDSSEYQYKDNRVYTKDMEHVQLETTSRCTLDCNYCSRFQSDKSTLNRGDLPISILKDVLMSKSWINVKDCGNYGDSIFYKHYHELLELMDSCVIKYYKLSTAATGRNKAWWDKTQELWKALNDSGINVIIFWGIDGLEDTSNKHRINQDWNEIFSNMQIAAKNGVECIWQFIPFSFNEHQIDEAKRIAKDIGVKFFLKPSERFPKNDPRKPTNKNLYHDTEIINNVKVFKNKPITEII